MTEESKKPVGLMVVVGFGALACAAGAFALVHRHNPAAAASDRSTVTHVTSTTQPATTRAAVVKKKKKQHK
jgi:hypothetical protein